MEALLVLLAIGLVAALVVPPVWAFIRLSAHDKELRDLRVEVALLKAASTRKTAAAPAALSRPEAPGPAPEPQSPPPVARSGPSPAPVRVFPLRPPLSAAVQRPKSGLSTMDWEQFLGAKLFAWLGGVALFLGVAFFVSYSFEHNLVPPAVRVALGFLLGVGLIAGGLRIPAPKYRITAQTLVASGLVSLYAVTFACNSIYHFPLFGPAPTFALMVLVTAAAFAFAVRLNAQVVAVLGIFCGFLTPILIHTHEDNPTGLFGYVGLLLVGLVAVALHRRWPYLVPLGAGGAVAILMQWTGEFFQAGTTGPTVITTVSLLFGAIQVLAYAIARRLNRAGKPVLWSAVGMCAVALAFSLFLLRYPAAGSRPGLIFLLVFGADALLLALAWLDDRLIELPPAAGVATFAVLACWSAEFLTDALVPWALAASLVLAILHTAFPMLLQRRRPAAPQSRWGRFFAPLALLLMLWPIFRFEAVSFVVWPAVLLVDGIAVIAAVAFASLVPVAAALVLSLVAAGIWLFQIPGDLTLDPALLLVVGGFALFFCLAGVWLAGRAGKRLRVVAPWLSGTSGGGEIPALSVLLPFFLLVMICARLWVPDPSAVFGLGLLLVVLALGLARLLAAEWLPVCALAGVGALEWAWHARHFEPAAPALPLAWYAAFYATFAAYPFAFRSRFRTMTGPWAAAALSGVVHFWVVYPAIKHGWPNPVPGLVPAAFAVAPLCGVAWIQRSASAPALLGPLAWFGGVALFFITLIFPIQFERQWITVGWALEGAALLWLFRRVPHPGLRATGAGLLLAVFVRLALNPAVLGYHARGQLPILNWYLYAYGLAVASLFLGARLLAPPRNKVLNLDARALLFALGSTLAFLLMNIEIADYFTPPGTRTLTFVFSGDFARDMTYTIAWALFALGLLGAGIWREQKSARYAAIGLLGVALIKLFLHDLARLEALYRVGALFGVAVIAILASFAYQKFMPNRG